MCNYFICGYLVPSQSSTRAADGYPSETCAGLGPSVMQTSLRVHSLSSRSPAREGGMTSTVLRQRDNSPNDEKGEGGTRGKQERANWRKPGLNLNGTELSRGIGAFPSLRPLPSRQSGLGPIKALGYVGRQGEAGTTKPASQPVGMVHWRNGPQPCMFR